MSNFMNIICVREKPTSKILFIIVLLSEVIIAQNKIPFASQNNTIELSVTNTATVDAGNVTVEVQSAPQWLKFTNSKTEISSLKSREAATASFSFSVDKSAPVNKPQTLNFTISSPTGEKWTKEIVIQVSAPEKFELFQNYPNPFNPSTTIEYALPKAGNVTLKIYDAIGKEVATLVNEMQEAGYYSARFDASKLSSGMYIYKLTSDKFKEVKKMMLMK